MGTGSPPRAWGQRRQPIRDRASPRFTPTRVGTTCNAPSGTAAPAVHPHARGDNVHCVELTFVVIGSPPRAWGQRLISGTGAGGGRFTPTRVGTTTLPAAARVCAPVHPHARGDNARAYQFGHENDGSPPRAWGQRLSPSYPRLRARFTPTRVGTTRPSVWSHSARTVHPHARGDNSFLLNRSDGVSGSPPRAWGQLTVPDEELTLTRFTPTRVGTTCWPANASLFSSVHPHARGDNSRESECFRSSSGSPPRAWGQHTMLGHRPMEGRFTPTRVGTTDTSTRRGAASRFTPTRVGTTYPLSDVTKHLSVHPHARGDNTVVSWKSLVPNGSPPRAWGQHPCARARRHEDRFTPTRVGTTRYSGRCRLIPSVHPHARGDN